MSGDINFQPKFYPLSKRKSKVSLKNFRYLKKFFSPFPNILKLKDFHKLVSLVSQLEAGVIINFGSAVILPEVFLKALNLARNLGYRVKKFTAVNFDQIMHYRPLLGIIRRLNE